MKTGSGRLCADAPPAGWIERFFEIRWQQVWVQSGRAFCAARLWPISLRMRFPANADNCSSKAGRGGRNGAARRLAGVLRGSRACVRDFGAWGLRSQRLPTRARQSVADVSGNPAAVRQRANAPARSLEFTGGSKSILLSFKCAPPTQGAVHFWQANSLSVE